MLGQLTDPPRPLPQQGEQHVGRSVEVHAGRVGDPFGEARERREPHDPTERVGQVDHDGCRGFHLGLTTVTDLLATASPPEVPGHQVVLIGAGFGGIGAAIELERVRSQAPRDAQALRQGKDKQWNAAVDID